MKFFYVLAEKKDDTVASFHPSKDLDYFKYDLSPEVNLFDVSLLFKNKLRLTIST